MSALLKEAFAIQTELVKHRRTLHNRPEVGFELPHTFAYVENELKKLGYKPLRVGRCGLTAVVGKGSPVSLLRADMDALPVQEESGLPFAAANGNAHLCGHDLHTAMLLGAAFLLKKHEQHLRGTVQLMFQPAEELLAGASDMLENGLLEGLEPDAAFMLHVTVMKEIPVGTIILPPAGASAPAADMFEIEMRGKGCHGAMPQNGVDAINAAAHLLLALQAVSTREVSQSDPHVLTIGAFLAGEAANVMPNRALLRGSVRSYEPDLQNFLKERILELAKHTASAFRASAQVRWLRGCPPLVNASHLVEYAQGFLQGTVGDEMVLASSALQGGNVRSVGSEDFAYISQRVPSVMAAVCAGNGEMGLHHPAVVFDEGALPYGAAAYAGFALGRGAIP